MSNPTISKGRTWASGETVIPTRLNNHVDDATIQCTQTDVVLGRSTSGAGQAEEIACTAAGRAVLAAATAVAQRELIIDEQRSVVSSQFDKIGSTSLSNITGMTATLVAEATYSFEAVLFTSLDASGLGKVAIGGTCSSSAFIADVTVDGAAGSVIFARTTTKGSAVSTSTTTATATYRIRGTVTVAAAGGGTLTVQFAQLSATGTSSVLVGSYFRVIGYA